MRDIYENAIDSLAVAIKFYLAEDTASSRKHTILTLFHSIELFLKEYLYRVNPILIYKDIDKKIHDDSLTVGLNDSLVRLENLKLGLKDEPKNIIERIRKRRNRIEHHKYDLREDDRRVIAESLKFILYFIEEVLEEKIDEDIEPSLIIEIQSVVMTHSEQSGLVHKRIERYIQQKWPDWIPYEMELPDEFEGTVECPVCGHESLLLKPNAKLPFCFWCNVSIETTECDICGDYFLSEEDHHC